MQEFSKDKKSADPGAARQSVSAVVYENPSDLLLNQCQRISRNLDAYREWYEPQKLKASVAVIDHTAHIFIHECGMEHRVALINGINLAGLDATQVPEVGGTYLTINWLSGAVEMRGDSFSLGELRAELCDVVLVELIDRVGKLRSSHGLARL